MLKMISILGMLIANVEPEQSDKRKGKRKVNNAYGNNDFPLTVIVQGNKHQNVFLYCSLQFVRLMKNAIIGYLKQASFENFRNVIVMLISNNRLWHCLRPTCTHLGYSQFIHQWDIPRRNSSLHQSQVNLQDFSSILFEISDNVCCFRLELHLHY